MLSTPASMKEGIRLSGFVTCRWASIGRSTAAASEAATAGPTVRLGTKWLSMTSKCTSAAPPLSARRTSSASSAKSAARIEGAPITLPPSVPKNVNRLPPNLHLYRWPFYRKGDLHYAPLMSETAVREPPSWKLLEIHAVEVIPLARCFYGGEAGEAIEGAGERRVVRDHNVVHIVAAQDLHAFLQRRLAEEISHVERALGHLYLPRRPVLKLGEDAQDQSSPAADDVGLIGVGGDAGGLDVGGEHHDGRAYLIPKPGEDGIRRVESGLTARLTVRPYRLQTRLCLGPSSGRQRDDEEGR